MELTVDLKLFIELLDRCIPFAGRDDTLPALMIVQLETLEFDGYLYGWACDRYKLGHPRMRIADDTEAMRFNLRVADAERIVRMARPRLKILAKHLFAERTITLRFDGHMLHVEGEAETLHCEEYTLTEPITMRQLLSNNVNPPPPVDVTPPQSPPVAVTQPPTDSMRFGLNLEHLAAAKGVQRRNEPMEFRVTNPNKPIVMETTDFVGIIMPVRLQEGPGSAAGHDRWPLGFDVPPPSTWEDPGGDVVGFTPGAAFEKAVAEAEPTT